MLNERIDSPPPLRLVTVEGGAWLRPAVHAPDAGIAALPAAHWASAPRRSGLRRSTVRVTCREAYRRTPRRSEVYRLAAAPLALAANAASDLSPRFATCPEPAARPGVLRLATELLSQVFNPVG